MEFKFGNYTVRLATMDDLPAYYQLIETNRKRLEDFFAGTVAITQTLEDTEQHLADVVHKAANNKYFPFLVVENISQHIIGSIQIKSIDWSIPKAELGYYIDAKYEGKGVTTKAIAQVIDFAFMQLKLAKLYIRTFEGNVSSRRIAEKNGFTVEGIIRCDYKTTAGVLIDTMYYGLVNPTLSTQ